ncbi:MAG: putative porin [Methylomonas sp.]|jgi:hypothetical protein
MTIYKQLIAAIALSGLLGLAHADEKEELLKLRNTTVNLIKQLVKQGVLTEKMANEMIKQAEADAEKQVAEAKKAAGSGAEGAEPAAAQAGKEPIGKDEVRVTYVPDFIKDEIRQQVRSELRDEVVGDVMQKAKDEQWGLPGALPDWVKRFKLSGDIRLREQSSMLPSDNISPINDLSVNAYPNYNGINTGTVSQAQTGTPNALLNTNINQNIGRERFRLGIDANVTEGVDAGIRLSIGNTQNPISTNQTLGNYGLAYQLAVDRAFLRYNAFDSYHYNWLTLMGGRTPNPFFTAGSEMVWDEDLSFEGASATVRQRLGYSQLADEIGGMGPSVFGALGVYPLQSQNPWTGLSGLQQWLFGGQGGLDWGFDNQDSLKIAAAYYDYQGIRGNINKSAIDNSCVDSSQNVTQTAPLFVQGGNTMVGLCGSGAAGTYSQTAGRYGFASDFQILNLNALYDFALFSPVHLKISADYAKNMGYNPNKILSYANGYISGPGTATGLGSGSVGWQVKFDLGWSRIDVPGNWNVYALYRYLESDAVLSSYTDSDFHLGFTNTKGWVLAGNYGIMKNVWLSGRWLSADIITGPNYSMDVMQLDINTRF